MTPLMLQDDLVDEIKRLLSGQLYKNITGDRIPINVYPQNVPVTESDDDVDPIPYIIVRLNSGEDNGTSESINQVKLVVIIGLYDDNLDSQGHRGLLNIISKLYERFQENPCLNNKYVYNGVFKWAIQEDGYYPYYFGAIEMNFSIPALRKEDSLA